MTFKELQQRYFSKRHLLIVDERDLLETLKALSTFPSKDVTYVRPLGLVNDTWKFQVAVTVYWTDWVALTEYFDKNLKNIKY